MEIFPEPQKFGQYRLFAKVDQGGMAEVFLATSTKKELLGQFLAIKKLHKALNSNKPFVNLLIHEAKIGVLLNHPSVAQVYDLGSFQTEFFIAMEYVHGKSLERLLEKIREKKAPPLSVEIASYIIFETLRALAFAHQLKDIKGRDLNIIHRDVTPGNILLEYKGNIKLTDFGIATAESRLQKDFTKAAMGKRIYMPPEQAVNDPVVRSSDLYSLTLVYFELLSGQLPFFSDTTTDLYKKIVDGKAQDIRMIMPSIKEDLAKIIRRGMDPSAKRRYRDAPEYFQALYQYFLTEEKIDFQSRTTRSYYRKKLSEYLRKNFHEAIVQEIQLIQIALDQSQHDEDLKATAPQRVPAELLEDELSGVDEKTVFYEDNTNEATRNFPLTDTERKGILDGLPPRQVLKEDLDDEDEKERTSGFELATIADYEDNFGEKAFDQVTVSDRLDQILLDHDDREQLRAQMPAQEIKTRAELDAFEDSTLSGKLSEEVSFEDSPESAMDSMVLQPISDAGSNSSSSFVRSSQNKTIASDAQSSRPSLVQDKIKKKLGLGISIGLAVLLIFSATYGVIEYFNRPPTGLFPTKQVSLVFLGEASLEKQRQVFRSLTDKKSVNSFEKLENVFNRSYQELTGQKKEVLRILAHEPVLTNKNITIDLISQKTRMPNFLLQQIHSQGFEIKQASDITIFIYFLPDTAPLEIKNLVDKGAREKRMENQSAIFAFTNETSTADLLLRLGREIALIYGAKDLQDPSTGMALTPEGFAEPGKKPLFPQEYAELMAKDIPTGLLQETPIERIDQVIIGPTTARNLKWISE